MTSEITWTQILEKLIEHSDLERTETGWAMSEMMSGEADPVLVSAFILGLRAKGESVQELAGLVDTMLANAVVLETGSDALDIVGTGGDMLGTVNISSMASIVAAATGTPVMKHGSRSASGKTGSSEMLEALGIRLDQTPAEVARIFEQVGLTFFFAPVFHPAMRHVAPVRKVLGIPTTFNFLGPLANPAQPIATSLGVSNSKIAPLLAGVLAARGRSGLVFRGNDGLDELTTTGASRIWAVSGGEIADLTLNPADFDLRLANLSDLVGGDAHHNAQVALDLFEGVRTGALAAVRDVVALNAAGGLVAYRLAKAGNLPNQDELNRAFSVGLDEAFAAIDQGKALAKLQSWIQATSN